jgi:hypothetical protein
MIKKIFQIISHQNTSAALREEHLLHILTVFPFFISFFLATSARQANKEEAGRRPMQAMVTVARLYLKVISDS